MTRRVDRRRDFRPFAQQKPGNAIAAARFALWCAIPVHRQERSCEPPGNHQAAEIPAAEIQQPNIDVRPRNKQNDSVEVYIGEEFLGLIFVDDEDGDRSYNFTMAILDVDLDEVK